MIIQEQMQRLSKLLQTIWQKVSERTSLDELAIWLLPPLIIPTLRWLQDPPSERQGLFIRDFTTYTIGALTYFAGKELAVKALSKLIHPRKELFAKLFGLGCNLLYAGIGAVQLSQRLSPKEKSRLDIQSKAPYYLAPERLPVKPNQPMRRIPLSFQSFQNMRSKQVLIGTLSQ